MIDTSGEAAVRIQPSEVFGAFEVIMAGELIFSKKSTGGLPHPGEVQQIIIERLSKQ